MRCSQCGGDTTSSGGLCPVCGAAAVQTLAATGVLTPLPQEPVPSPAGGDPLAATVAVSSSAVTPAATGRLAPGQAFGNRYHIIRTLGQGGMGCVYHAWDAELGVAVALKVIKPEIAQDPQAAAEIERRFKRELLLARQVSHRNVVRIHDLGDVAGTKYITMSYVEGADLAAVLAREGKLPVPRIVRLARQIAAGLAAAHEVGVVHRDLKPANVMVDAHDTALIMDFGIARSVALDSGFGTIAGTIVGTVDYMAPEQAQGQPVDGRADVYAFGLILYDLLLGRRPASAGGDVAALMARMKAPPLSARSIDPSIPEALDAIVMKCVQPDPAARFQTSAELVKALDAIDDSGLPLPVPIHKVPKLMLAAAALAIGVAAGALTWWFTGPPAAPVQREPVSVLVADFENRTGDPVFEGSLEQSLSIAMEGSPFISVVPQQRARSLAAQVAPSSQGRVTKEVGELIARREGVKVLLAGSIAGADSGFELAVRAIDAGNGAELAVERRAVASKADVLQAIGSLAERIRRDLGETTTAGERVTAAETFTAGSVEAMRAYARGQDLMHAGNYQQALQAFEQALRDDPNLGRAYAAMGAIYSNLKQMDRARSAYEEAMKRLDRMSDREKYRTLASYYIGIAGNHEKAIENYEALLQRFPADNVAYGNLALAHLHAMNVARAREVARRGLELYPNNLLQRTNYAAYSLYAGDFETAAREAEHVLKENSRYEFAYLPLALSHAARGDLTAARGAYDRLSQVSSTGQSMAATGHADIEMYRGASSSALGIARQALPLDEKLESTGELAIKRLLIAEASLAAGDRARAAAEAKRAIELARAVNVVFPAARIFIELGQDVAAQQIARDLENRLQNQTVSYARLIEGELELKRRRFPEAIDALREAQRRHDSWLSRYLLGRAYLDAGAHAAEALEEFERCYRRRGEVADVFFSDSPTMRYLPPLYYWLGRAREAVGARESAQVAYREYVKIRGEAAADPLLADARRRTSAAQ